MAKLNKKNFIKNLANIITLIRVVLIFIAIAFLNHRYPVVRKGGFIILPFACLLDGLDGVLARKFNTQNNTGSLIDTLGDRITENVLLVFFAYKNLIPLFVPLVFILRSFIADFVRFLAYSKGIGTFSINSSRFGFYTVASKTSRVVYLLLKFIVFLLGAFILSFPDKKIFYKFSLSWFLFYIATVLVIINILRFIGLLYDSRSILKEEFLKE